MRKSPVSDRMARVEARIGKTTKGTAEKPRPAVKVKARPTGGLKPSGVKGEIKITW